MLQRLTVRNFKSFRHATMEFPRLAVLFGPNAVGKSNLLDAIQALSRIGTQRTLADALGEPIRGYPFEMFKLPAGGIAELLTAPTAQFSLEADLAIHNGARRPQEPLPIWNHSRGQHRRGITRQPPGILGGAHREGRRKGETCHRNRGKQFDNPPSRRRQAALGKSRAELCDLIGSEAGSTILHTYRAGQERVAGLADLLPGPSTRNARPNAADGHL